MPAHDLSGGRRPLPARPNQHAGLRRRVTPEPIEACSRPGWRRAGSELEEVGACVVPDHVKVEVSAVEGVEVEIGDEDVLPAEAGTGKDRAEGVDDTAPAHDDGVVGAGLAEVGGQLVRVVAPDSELVGGQDKAAALDTDVAHGRGPGVTAVDRGGAVQLHVLLVERGAVQRHIALPADSEPDPAYIGRDDGDVGGPATAPDKPLGPGGHE